MAHILHNDKDAWVLNSVKKTTFDEKKKESTPFYLFFLNPQITKKSPGVLFIVRFHLCVYSASDTISLPVRNRLGYLPLIPLVH